MRHLIFDRFVYFHLLCGTSYVSRSVIHTTDTAFGMFQSLNLLVSCTFRIIPFDNHRVLHGRTDLTVDGKRWLQWVQIERGDFHSSLRILADRLGQARDARPLMRGAYGNIAGDREK